MLELQCCENQIDDKDEEHTALVKRRARRIGIEIKRILEHLNPRKIAGHDEIGNRILRKLPRKAAVRGANGASRVKSPPTATWKPESPKEPCCPLTCLLQHLHLGFAQD
ncbi:hypothetical protein NQ315_015154 [Exocentrus adspersus]|uniref:Uncharacterized protein n=1 Tax=Exocentrus adspersus TaxID=1586481 RepID=A0AAV8VEZ0_9CUCU|nr:hypothetical protein NQ315_015154 [Exocentrus adspersus]